MADVSKMAEEWLSEHPDASKKDIWLAGYWKSTDNGATEPNKILELWQKEKVKSKKLLTQPPSRR